MYISVILFSDKVREKGDLCANTTTYIPLAEFETSAPHQTQTGPRLLLPSPSYSPSSSLNLALISCFSSISLVLLLYLTKTVKILHIYIDLLDLVDRGELMSRFLTSSDASLNILSAIAPGLKYTLLLKRQFSRSLLNGHQIKLFGSLL